MKAIVFRELKANRKGLLIWMAGMLFMVAIGAAEYGTVVENAESITCWRLLMRFSMEDMAFSIQLNSFDVSFSFFEEVLFDLLPPV